MTKTLPPTGVKQDATQRPPRRRLDREAREAEIVEAAYREFAAGGYGATTISDIARRANVAKGLVHFYFPSKEDLLKAVVRRQMPPLFAQMETAAANAKGTTSDLLCTALESVYASLVGDARAREVLRLLVAEGSQFPELTEFYYEEAMKPAHEFMTKLLARGVACGEFREGAIQLIPHVVYGPALMAVFWQLIVGNRHPLDLSSMFKAHVDLVLNGLRAPQQLAARKGRAS